jgi:flagellar biosynthetic protein FlhB
MAETDFQERSEQASAKRRQDARERGQVPRSREANMAAVLLGGGIALLLARERFGGALAGLMRKGLTIDAGALDRPEYMSHALASAGIDMLVAFAPLMIALALAAVAGALAVGGWVFSTEPFTPQWSRLNPVQGFGRLFGLQGFAEVAKALGKGLFVAGFAVAYLASVRHEVVNLGLAPLGLALSRSGSMVATTLLVCGAAVLLIALADVPFQMWSHGRALRMTRQEIREELKESEGRPEVRGRIRSMQQQLANRRMLREVPKADVVVTNPTHFAVALRYEDGRMRAPVVIAKGVDHMAARIRAVASEHRVPLFEAPVLARALYWTTNLNQEIPGPLYVAVAQVLTYVYRIKAAVQGRGTWPDRPAVKVDETLAEPRGLRPGPGRKPADGANEASRPG